MSAHCCRNALSKGNPMHFKHCGVHQREFQERLYGDNDASDDAAFSFIILSCGTCHQRYFSDFVAAADSDECAAMFSQIEYSLLAECPDHAHVFAIAPSPERQSEREIQSDW
jgi:hypothetical protein